MHAEQYAENFTFLSGNLLALLKSIRSSNRKTWRRHFLPFPCQTKNSFCRNSLPCSFTFTYENNITSFALYNIFM